MLLVLCHMNFIKSLDVFVCFSFKAKETYLQQFWESEKEETGRWGGIYLSNGIGTGLRRYI